MNMDQFTFFVLGIYPLFIMDVLHLQKVSGNVYYPFGIYGKHVSAISSYSIAKDADE